MAEHPTGATGQSNPDFTQTTSPAVPNQSMPQTPLNQAALQGVGHIPAMAARPKSVSATAIVGLVLGVLAIAGCWIPIINNISFFGGLIGLVFSIIGTVGTVRGKSNGKGIAIAGLVLNVLSMVLVLWLQSLWSAALS